MRTKVIFTGLLAVFVAVFIFTKPDAKENNVTNNVSTGTDTIFRICAWWDGKVMYNYDSLKELGINLWHITGRISNGWTGVGVANDNRESDYSLYGQNVKDRIERNYSEGNLKSIMDRSKINYLGFGKRSDYECEQNNINPNFWFYYYGYHNMQYSRDTLDNSQYGSSNTYVRYSKVSNGNTEGYVVKDLIANREQISFTFGEPEQWHIMPRIRIDSAFAADPNNYNKPVCYIEIKNYYGNSIVGKERINLYVKHFLDINNHYNGKYLEQYNFSQTDTNLFIESTAKFNPDHKQYILDECQVDFRVYWCGQCDMWIDRVRVENEIAYDLFGDNLASKTNYNKYQDWLLWEAEYISKNNPNVHYFLIDEPEFATLPVLSYLNKKIIQLSNNTTSLVPIFSRWNFKAGLRNKEHVDYSLDQLKAYLIDSLGLKMYFTESYPFYGWDCCSKLPNTLPHVTTYDPVNGQLGKPVSPSEYEYWLQDYMDDTTHQYLGYDEFIKTVKYAYELYKQNNLPFSFMIQQHINYAGDGQLREPTNEEIAMMTNVAVSYGAKEITYFPFTGYGDLPAPNPNTINYCKGLADPVTFNKRDRNVYWQNKWEAVKIVTSRLTKWGPKLMSFSNTGTNSYIYRIADERNSLLNNSYFSHIITLHQGTGQLNCNDGFIPQNIPSGYIYECQNSTYLQVATFENNEPNTKYFMVVNRRCSPYKNDYSDDNIGGRRKIRAYIKSDYAAFSSSERWQIIDCENDKVIAGFDRNNPGYIDLGWFMPGEGKLFKIVPTQN